MPAHLLAPCSPQGLISPSSHANTARIFPAHRRTCWRLVPRQALSLRRATPTFRPESRLAAALVGALFPARPYLTVRPRQHGPDFPSLPTHLLAPCSLPGLISPSGHANRPARIPTCRRTCWRRPARQALSLRPATPT